jgi:hypothetical protein
MYREDCSKNQKETQQSEGKPVQQTKSQSLERVKGQLGRKTYSRQPGS